MRRTLLACSLVLILTGCSTPNQGVDGPANTSAAAPASAALRFDTAPQGLKTAGRACPYLDSQWVADTNGQKMQGTDIDERFDPPACLFWSYQPQEQPQATVLVRRMATVADARNVVDFFAPVATTDPASEPAGWEGGRYGGEGHAVYAVQKDNVAVVVTSSQEQSVKAQLIAEETIKNLGL